MRSSEISAVAVWGVSMSMRVRHGLRARVARSYQQTTPLFEIQAAYRRPMGEQEREISFHWKTLFVCSKTRPPLA